MATEKPDDHARHIETTMSGYDSQGVDRDQGLSSATSEKAAERGEVATNE